MKEPMAAYEEHTACRQLEPGLNGIEHSFYHLLMQAPVAMVVFRGPDFIIEFANDLYFSLIGQSREALLNKPAFEVLPHAREQGFDELLRHIRQTGEPFRLSEHETYIERNGRMETAYLSIMHQPVKEPDGSVDKMMVMIHDVTEQVVARKQKEEESALLKKMRDQLSLSISVGNIGLWHWDVQAGTLTWSDEQLQLYGISRSGFTGKVDDFMRFVYPEDKEKIYQTGELAGDQSGDYEYQFRIRLKNGQTRWLQARSRAFYDNNGRLLSVTGVNMDITAQKEAEEGVRK